ncbi:hypothetical protein MSIMFI_05479 [Mycobacterium simulans]|nr:hypothetical protein MSIMFI_05479 [Mycobacterium simulans]
MTTPAASAPIPSSGMAPKATMTSWKFRPAARMATRICPGASSLIGSVGTRTRLDRSPLPVVPSCHVGVSGGVSEVAGVRRGV